MTAISLGQRFAEITVPRYTSYPTAADFTDKVGAKEQATWLAQLDPAEPISVYLHVPYCRQLCHYCGCHAKAVRKDGPVEEYRQALEAEIALVAARLPGRMTVGRIAWGGGTPSILGEHGLKSVVEVLKDHFDFATDFEHSIELDPRMLDASLARALARLGVNRASLGVQDLHPMVQQAIGRVQPEQQVAQAVYDLREAGISRINFDLIYGLPNQTEEGLLATCRSVAALSPDRIAFYGYAHLPTRRANQRLIDESLLPDSHARMRLAETIATFFPGEGYEPIGIDHFAKPNDPLAVAGRSGGLHRNFQGYTDDGYRTLLGFGCSSISRLPSGYVQSVSGIEAYKELTMAGQLPALRGHEMAEDDDERGWIIERLMCDFEVNIESQSRKYVDEIALLRPLVQEGLVAVSGSHIRLSNRGRPFVRLVAATFDSYRQDDVGIFSPSV
ncbi:oxygen-independent coproporphyrinogen III oxidase [Neorhizobium sp. NPDC001467]|uniref:oxygen-independent coproporphyrinogen III oxidase n=1 Tax=Neorhizobium sp. NPDC001467 TaxID=3390595 RepID=UPI003D01CE1E